MQFAQSGGAGSAASVFLRGANSSQVLVLVDGVPLNAAVAAPRRSVALRSTPSTASRFRAATSRASTDRRRSAAWCRSSRAAPASRARACGGRRAGPPLQRHRQRVDRSWRPAHRRRGGHPAQPPVLGHRRRPRLPGPFTPGANPDIDGNENSSGSIGASYRTQAGPPVRGQCLGQHRPHGLRQPPTVRTRRIRSDRPSRHGTPRVRAPLAANWNPQLELGEMQDHSRNTSSAPFSFNNCEFESRTAQASWTNELAVSERVKAQLGVEYLQQRGASTAFDRTSRRAHRVLPQRHERVGGMNGNAERQLVQLNVRQTATRCRLGTLADLVRLQADARVADIARVSNAFRAPSFSDLYYPFFGNPHWNPKKSRSGELACTTWPARRRCARRCTAPRLAN